MSVGAPISYEDGIQDWVHPVTGEVFQVWRHRVALPIGPSLDDEGTPVE